jgi:beta-mannosidase
VAVECNNDAVKFLDNLVDVVPGETVRIAIEGATQDTEFTTRCLNLIG